MAEGEQLKEVHVRDGTSLDAIRFVTSMGRASQWYGNTRGGGLREPLVAADGFEIVGLRRNRHGFCPPLSGIVTKRVSQPPLRAADIEAAMPMAFAELEKV